MDIANILNIKYDWSSPCRFETQDTSNPYLVV